MRLFGVLLLSLVPVAAGFLFSGREARGLKELGAFLALVAHIRYEIDAFLTRQSDLFFGFENEVLEKNGFLPSLRALASVSGEAVLYRALTENSSRLSLKGEEMRLISEYARHLGENECEEEVSRAKKTEELLEKLYEKRREGVREKMRLYRTFGIVTGISVLLLFV